MNCVKPTCRNIAEYNYEHYSNPAYCSKHKNSNMSYKREYNCIIL